MNNESFRSYIVKTYLFMALAVLISAVSAYVVITSMPEMAIKPVFAWTITAVSLLIAWFFNNVTVKNAPLGMTLLVIFSILEGSSLASLAFCYTQASIVSAFFTACAIFLLMAIFGMTTNMDLTKWGTYGLIALIGIILVSLVNMFILKSSGFSLLISIISVIVFTGLTAYDAQRAVHDYRHLALYHISATSMSIINAFSLYLDFINLFIELVEIFGNNDN